MKRKKTLGALISLGLIAGLVLMVNTGYSQDKEFKMDNGGNISMNVTENYSDVLPIELKTQEEEQVIEEKAGIQEFSFSNEKRNAQSKKSLSLNIDLTPTGDFYKVNGSGSLEMDGVKNKIELIGSTISKVKLKSGDTYVFGPLDAIMTKENEETEEIIIGLGSIVETGQRYFSLTLGNFGEGISYLIFGDTSFLTEEIADITTEYAGG
ncbi:hypothetical protein J45TS6_36350 [Paenibacillus sp. J45TS6]|uniref:Uncharacterized protein n=1 Tax=Paenibacillus gallinarum TaxID=2762232 RepID=A0ABR8T6K3_9BACL|nr:MULTISPECIES: hypothetical protein [Paenibacillus]MBD7971390.1 hypothetical protein [Paenibacillus gallinarum]GIP45176.1 hypothetical protein J45TS6_36350 [Paenibacillus sp. J45TS6]